MSTIRERLLGALAGEPVGAPVYAVYDWFVKNRPIGWPCLFAKGLGVIGHAYLLRAEYPGARDSIPAQELKGRLRAMARGAGRRFCMMISEEVPPFWERTVPLVLGELDRLGGAA